MKSKCPDCGGNDSRYRWSHGHDCPTCNVTGEKPLCSMCKDVGWYIPVNSKQYKQCYCRAKDEPCPAPQKVPCEELHGNRWEVEVATPINIEMERDITRAVDEEFHELLVPAPQKEGGDNIVLSDAGGSFADGRLWFYKDYIDKCYLPREKVRELVDKLVASFASRDYEKQILINSEIQNLLAKLGLDKEG